MMEKTSMYSLLCVERVWEKFRTVRYARTYIYIKITLNYKIPNFKYSVEIFTLSRHVMYVYYM